MAAARARGPCYYGAKLTMSATRDMLRASRRRVVEVAEECDPCRVLDAARAGHEGRKGLREEELVDAREVAHERERRRVEPLRVGSREGLALQAAL